MSLSDHKDTIQRLYVDEDLTLDELMDSMERNFGICASKDTYKRYFKKWQLRKNNNHDFYIWANHRIEKRSHANPKKKTQILLNGKAIDKKTIQKNIPRQVSTYDQARAAGQSSKPADIGIRKIVTFSSCKSSNTSRLQHRNACWFDLKPAPRHFGETKRAPIVEPTCIT
ncbi:hypothetical protein ABZX51_005977 [Aspergillus tubingensis]